MIARALMADLCDKSRNLNRRFGRPARIVSEKIPGVEGVVGMVAAGGIGRGHSDKFSSLDRIVSADESVARDTREYIAVVRLHDKEIRYDIPMESSRRGTSPIMSIRQAQKIRGDLWVLDGRIGRDITGIAWEDVLETDRPNWDRASEKTRYYLGW